MYCKTVHDENNNQYHSEGLITHQQLYHIFLFMFWRLEGSQPCHHNDLVFNMASHHGSPDLIVKRDLKVYASHLILQ